MFCVLALCVMEQMSKISLNFFLFTYYSNFPLWKYFKNILSAVSWCGFLSLISPKIKWDLPNSTIRYYSTSWKFYLVMTFLIVTSSIVLLFFLRESQSSSWISILSANLCCSNLTFLSLYSILCSLGEILGFILCNKALQVYHLKSLIHYPQCQFCSLLHQLECEYCSYILNFLERLPYIIISLYFLAYNELISICFPL